jgi:hypothetical protein
MSLFLGGLLTVGGSAISAIGAHKAQKTAERREKKSRQEMNRLKDVYSQLDTSNPYLDMENTMEDLTINQRQYDLQTEQFQQSQANILGGLSEAAGSSGIAGVAQALAQQGQLQAQQSSAEIGDQERQNEMMERQMAGQLQAQEREGEVLSREMEMDKQGTLLGMAQQDVAAYREQAAAARQAKFDAISGGVSSLGSMLTAGSGGGGGGGGFFGGGGGDPQGRYLNDPSGTGGGGFASLDEDPHPQMAI